MMSFININRLTIILVGVVDKYYIRSLRDKYIDYANVKILIVLTHLYTGYERIVQGGLEGNGKWLKE